MTRFCTLLKDRVRAHSTAMENASEEHVKLVDALSKEPGVTLLDRSVPTFVVGALPSSVEWTGLPLQGPVALVNAFRTPNEFLSLVNQGVSAGAIIWCENISIIFYLERALNYRSIWFNSALEFEPAVQVGFTLTDPAPYTYFSVDVAPISDSSTSSSPPEQMKQNLQSIVESLLRSEWSQLTQTQRYESLLSLLNSLEKSSFLLDFSLIRKFLNYCNVLVSPKMHVRRFSINYEIHSITMHCYCYTIYNLMNIFDIAMCNN